MESYYFNVIKKLHELQCYTCMSFNGRFLKELKSSNLNIFGFPLKKRTIVTICFSFNSVLLYRIYYSKHNVYLHQVILFYVYQFPYKCLKISYKSRNYYLNESDFFSIKFPFGLLFVKPLRLFCACFM